MKEYKLKFETVPTECWYSNLRSALPKALWDKIRFDAYRRAGGACQICGAKTTRLEAHERWSYDEKKKLQTLVDVVALCRRCHEVVHISRSQLVGKGADAMEHFMRVNGATQSEFHEALKKSNEEYEKRNRIEGWTTDISWIRDNGYA